MNSNNDILSVLYGQNMEKVKWTFEVTVEPDWFCVDGKRKDSD